MKKTGAKKRVPVVTLSLVGTVLRGGVERRDFVLHACKSLSFGVTTGTNIP